MKKPKWIFIAKKLPRHQLVPRIQKSLQEKTKHNWATNGSALLQNLLEHKVSHQIQWDVTVWLSLD